MAQAPSSPDPGAGAAASGDAPETAGSRSSGPVLGLLARGLELWLRQQCDGIERLEIRLEGSAAQLMGGRLEGVVLEARRVTYRNLRIDRVELRSDPIRVRMGALLRSKSVQLDHPFAVRGLVSFNADDLARSLASPAWRSLGDGLAEELLGVSPLAGLRMEADRLILMASGSGTSVPLEVAAEVQAADGTVLLRSRAGGVEVRLPMDPSIRIDRAELASGLLELRGEALVSP
jgi:hypothetical protein